jgi:hypothetical protein
MKRAWIALGAFCALALAACDKEAVVQRVGDVASNASGSGIPFVEIASGLAGIVAAVLGYKGTRVVKGWNDAATFAGHAWTDEELAELVAALRVKGYKVEGPA